MKKPALSGFSRLRPNVLLTGAFVLAALFLLIGTKSSPLYPMNDWVDVNVYMTLGRGILHGRVPHRDLFEQKGPVFLFVHALLAFFFRKGYFGIYLLEVICMGLFLYFSGKICSLYVKNRIAPWAVMLFLGTAVPVSPAFSQGGGLEELFLFAFSASLYYVLRALRNGRLLSAKESVIIGILAGAAFWSKYTFCGFFAALAVSVVIWYASMGKWSDILKTAGFMLAGLGAVSLPVFGDFAVNGALGDLFDVYFVRNMTSYARTEKSAQEYIRTAFRLTFSRNKKHYNWLLWPGAAFLLVGFFRRFRESLTVLLCFSGLIITTYMSSPGYSYYGLVLAPFAVFGLCAIAAAAEAGARAAGLKLKNLTVPKSARLLLAAGLIIAAGTGMGIIYHYSANTYLMDYRKEEMPQYIFAEVIRQVPDATLLNYWCLDGGFYYTAGVEPVNRFFCYFNLNPPELAKEQQGLIRDGAVDFVVTRRNPLSPALQEAGKYRLVRTANFWFDARYYDYYLYQRQR